jgi:D-psicose/D-tagatose/L-ribulose 3-epimerase
MTNNLIGIISMQHTRPFTAAHFPQFARWRAAGFDFVELLVPEPGELDLATTRRALQDAGLGVALAARVNLDRNLCSDDETRRRAGRDYLRYCVEVAHALGAGVVGGPLYGNPLVFVARAPPGASRACARRRRSRRRPASGSASSRSIASRPTSSTLRGRAWR